MRAPAGLVCRDDLTGLEGLAPVHGLVRDMFGLDVAPLYALDLADPTYRAFAYLDGAGRCAANAAAFALRLVVGGRRVDAMGIQSVATRPAWRHQGLSHDLMQRALRWCDSQSELTLLMTPIPAFYSPMGFRIVPQFAFAGPAPAIGMLRGRCRPLDLSAVADRQTLVRALRCRVPVSQHFAVDGEAGSFVLNLSSRPGLTAWELEPSNAVVVTADRADGLLCLVDVAAASMPGLAEIVACLGVAPTGVEVQFPPDRLGWRGAPVQAHPAEVLMVRGPFESPGPFMLPETAIF